MNIKKAINSNILFGLLVFVFVISVGIASVVREGNDLKVYIYGAQAIQARTSPYINPTDNNRLIYRYAPPFAFMTYPFLAVNKLLNLPPLRYEIAGENLKYYNITFVIIAFYISKVLVLAASAFLLFMIAPPLDNKKAWSGFKIAFLLASPFIAYELANNQNKLIALFFLLLAIALFEKSRPWLSGISFNLAVAIYVPLAAFLIYFFRYNKRYLAIFFVTALVVFVIAPSLVAGYDYNNYILKEWYVKCLKPFFFAESYSSYTELRHSSQSLPSAIGRVFVKKEHDVTFYFIGPVFINIIVRSISFLIVLLSILAVWLSSGRAKGLQISVLLILSLILPSYCLVYTWAYMFVIYFYIFGFLNDPYIEKTSKPILLASGAAVFLATCLMAIVKTLYMSLIFWSTLLLLAGLVYAMLRTRGAKTA